MREEYDALSSKAGQRGGRHAGAIAALMRSFVLLATSSAALGCFDYGIDVDGVVLDPQEQPVPLADYIVDDRGRNEELDSYFSGRSSTPPFVSRTDELGRFDRSITLGGTEFHDVWIVVGKAGLQDYSERVWAGDGGPNEKLHLTVRMQSD